MKSLKEKLSLHSILEFLINKPLKQYNDGYVDLDLPSKTLWATANLGANNPEDIGNYYPWGGTTASIKANKNYSCISHDLDNSTDIVYIKTNGEYSIPSKEQCQELLDNTTQEYDGNKKIFILTSKINKKKLIFPASSYYNDERTAKENNERCASAFIWIKEYAGQSSFNGNPRGSFLSVSFSDKLQNSIGESYAYLLSNVRGVKTNDQ